MAIVERKQEVKILSLLSHQPSFRVFACHDGQGNLVSRRLLAVDTFSGRFGNVPCSLSMVISKYDDHTSFLSLRTNNIDLIYDLKLNHKAIVFNNNQKSFEVTVGKKVGNVYFVSKIESLMQFTFLFSDDGVLESQEGIPRRALKKLLVVFLRNFDTERIIIQVGNRCTINAGLIEYYNIKKTDIGSRLLTM
jgi:hypothetical protein